MCGISDIAVRIRFQIDTFWMKCTDDFISRSDMIAVGMGSYVEFKVIFCNTHTFQIGNHLIFESQSFGNACT